MAVIDVLLIAIAVCLLIPASVYCVECLVAVVKGYPPRLAKSDERPRVAVVIPAHNEQAAIGNTVRHVKQQLAAGERLIVVADNCTDRTATEARKAGAETWARNEPEYVGKGYAMSYAVSRLAARPPEVVVFIDADCRLSQGTIDSISRAAIANQRPIQSDYRFVTPPGSPPLNSISALACLVRNLVRPVGLHHMGFPCHLTGSGMAFPWKQLHEAPAQEDNIVEDLALGLGLALKGHEPLYCGETTISTNLPQAQEAAQEQRKRWEHGQIATFLSFTPKLIVGAVSARRLSLVALAADLLVPPLALLVALICAWGFVSGAAAMLGMTAVAFPITALSLGMVGTATVFAWGRFGRRSIPAVGLLLAPLYVIWKLPIYLALLGGKAQKSWIRTARVSSEPLTPP